MEKIKAKVEQVLHKDNTTSTTGTHHQEPLHSSNATHTGYGGQHTGTTNEYAHGDPSGPHTSHLANKADPRVDSDRVGGYGNTASAGGNTHTGYGGHNTGVTGEPHHQSNFSQKLDSTSGGYNNGPATTGGYGAGDQSGPHNTHLGNKMDPRVDSDLPGPTGNTAGVGGYETRTGGPHSSNLANKLDPTVKTGHSTTGGYGNTAGGYDNTAGGYGNTASTTGSTTGFGTGHHTTDPSGPHNTHLGNKADPRVDSDYPGATGNTRSAGGATHTGYGDHTATGGVGHGQHHTGLHSGPGPAENTAGPHKSDLLNKADPRVDSDLSGGKTYGGDKTYDTGRPGGY